MKWKRDASVPGGCDTTVNALNKLIGEFFGPPFEPAELQCVLGEFIQLSTTDGFKDEGICFRV